MMNSFLLLMGKRTIWVIGLVILKNILWLLFTTKMSNKKFLYTRKMQMVCIGLVFLRMLILMKGLTVQKQDYSLGQNKKTS